MSETKQDTVPTLEGEALIAREANIARARQNLIEKYGMRFTEAEKYTLPQLNLKAFEKEGVDPLFAADVVRFIHKYLSYPIIEDDLSDQERDSLKKELFADPTLGKAYREILEDNKLRANKLSSLVMPLQVLITEIEQTAPKSDVLPVLKGLFNTIPNSKTIDSYRAASLEDKKKVVGDVSKRLVEFLHLFAPATKVQHAGM